MLRIADALIVNVAADLAKKLFIRVSHSSACRFTLPAQVPAKYPESTGESAALLPNDLTTPAAGHQ